MKCLCMRPTSNTECKNEEHLEGVINSRRTRPDEDPAPCLGAEMQNCSSHAVQIAGCKPNQGRNLLVPLPSNVWQPGALHNKREAWADRQVRPCSTAPSAAQQPPRQEKGSQRLPSCLHEKPGEREPQHKRCPGDICAGMCHLI